MHTEFLIIGQGISGSFLSWYLQQEGRSFLVIDDHRPSAASRVAAGMINPVTGRRIVKTWMIDNLLPFAVSAYQKWGESLGIPAIDQKNIVSFFPSLQMRAEFEKRVEEQMDYISLPSDPREFSGYFQYDWGYGIISPAYAVNLAGILPAWRKTISDRVIEEEFDITQLSIGDDAVHYKEISADYIIFCDGPGSFTNPWFHKLPFAENKGQALIIRTVRLPSQMMYKKAMTIVPLDSELYWVGSSYEWDFADPLPSEEFIKRTETLLKAWLRAPFTVEEHLSALRPATLERRPFVGMHPYQPRVGILNGMGTKGCSLAPLFAQQLVQRLCHQQPLLPEADIHRFKKILGSHPGI